MLPEPYRLRRRADFSATVRGGRRMGRQALVVHARERGATDTLVSIDGPRFGLVVSKAVGPAVIRHRVARRFRHICAGLVDTLPVDTDVVIRALPGSATATSRELDKQLRSVLRRMDLLADEGKPA